MSVARRKRRASQTAAEPRREKSRPQVSERTLWICVGLIVVTLLVYLRVWDHEFVDLDDFNYITRNPNIRDGLTWRGIVWAFTTTGYEGNWHPLTWLSHMLDLQLYGLNPAPHHVTNVLFHIANTLLLFGVLHRMTAAPWRSAVVAGLFALHPLHVESVAWASERKDVLSTLFWMLTLWAYVGYVRQPRTGRYLAVLGLFALGLMAKPMLVTLPFVLLLLDYWPLGRLSGSGGAAGRPGGPRAIELSASLRLVREKLPFFALTAASCVMTFVAQRQGGAVAASDWAPLAYRLGNALVSYVAYLGKMIWPVQLIALYPYRQSLPTWQIVGSVLVLLAVSVGTLLAARRRPYLPVGWFWYLGTLVPVIGIIQVGNQAMADRYTYVPLIGVFIVLAWGIPDLVARWPYRHIALPAAAGLALVACAVAAVVQVGYWKNSMVLWTRAVEAGRNNFLAHYHLANMLVDRKRGDVAITHYTEAIRIRPDFTAARNNLGFTLASLGRVDEAIGEYTELIRLLPTYVAARNNLASALATQGKIDDAIREVQEALRIASGDVESHVNLATLFKKKGQLAEAAHHYADALRLKPEHVDAHYLLGLVLVEQGKDEEAARHFQTALGLEPSFQRARRALDELRNRRSPTGRDTR